MLQQLQGNKALRIVKSTPQLCPQHDQQIIFVCLDCAQTTPLLCTECIFSHKSHKWAQFKQFMQKETIPIFESSQSPKGKDLAASVEHIGDLLQNFKIKISQRIQKMQQKLLKDLKILRQIFPTEGGYTLKGYKLDNKTMSQVLTIVNCQKNFYEAKRLYNTFEQIFNTSQMNVNENFDKLQSTLNDRDWHKFKRRDLDFIKNSFVKEFEKPSNKKDFFFSGMEKSKCIQVEKQRSLAVLKRQYPPNAAILADKFFNSDNNFVAFKIVEVPTTIKVIKNTEIFVGAAIFEKAEAFNYHNLFKESHGSYLISSQGKSFHTKLPEYHQKNINFSFGKDDIITVLIDYEKRAILFEKTTGFLFTKFEMKLEIDEKYMMKLRPCVCFKGELGAEVQIYSQAEYDYMLYQKQQKKKKKKFCGKKAK